MRLQQFPVVASETGGRVYEMLVPFDTAVDVSLFTRDFVLANATGEEIGSEEILVPVQIGSVTAGAAAASGADRDIVFSVVRQSPAL